VIATDHCNLEIFEKLKLLRKRHYNWFEELSGVKTNIIYLNGTYNNIADSLSGIFTSENENINDTKTIYPSLIKISYHQRISQTIKSVKQTHEEKENCHPRQKQTYLLCIGMVDKEHLRLIVNKICKYCLLCQKFKRERKQKQSMSEAFKYDIQIMEKLSIDIIGPILSEKLVNKYFVLVIDCFSRYVWTWATGNTLTTDTLFTLISKIIDFYPMFKTKEVLTDCGTQFSSERWKKALPAI
jgi:Integrase core domain